MTLPATVGELLARAEGELEVLTRHLLDSRRPPPPPPLLAWLRFRHDAAGALQATLVPGVPTHPVDAAVTELARQGRRAAPTRADFEADGERQLVRIGRLMGAAGDLLGDAPPFADDAHAVAARMAGLTAATAQVLATSVQRHATPANDAFASIVATNRAAAQVLDAHAGRGTQSGVDARSAEPTTLLHGTADRLAAAALAWRRTSAECEPAAEVMIVGAVTSGRVAVTAWIAAERAIDLGLVKEAMREPLRDQLRQAALAWRTVAQDWRNYVTAAPRPESVRAAVAALHGELDTATHDIRSLTRADAQELHQLVQASRRALGHATGLASAQESLADRLARSGLLFEPARRQRGGVDLLGNTRNFVTAPSDAGGRLTANHHAAHRRTESARATLTAAIITRSPQTSSALAPTAARRAAPVAPMASTRTRAPSGCRR